MHGRTLSDERRHDRARGAQTTNNLFFVEKNADLVGFGYSSFFLYVRALCRYIIRIDGIFQRIRSSRALHENLKLPTGYYRIAFKSSACIYTPRFGQSEIGDFWYNQRMKRAQKLYAYVDESGQDTRGRMFVVGIVVLEQEREKIGQELERIEEQSGKRIKKWHKASHDHRIAYFEDITRSRVFHDTLFFEIFTESRKYIEMTSYATAKAILKKASGDNYTATIFIDGFRKREIEVFTHGLRDLHIKRRKVRGVKKEESSSFVRLADALCGLIHDASADPWATATLNKMKKEGIVTSL